MALAPACPQWPLPVPSLPCPCKANVLRPSRRRLHTSSPSPRKPRKFRRRGKSRTRECWWRIQPQTNYEASNSSSSSDDDIRVTSRCYHTDTESNMPGGFENSAMKTSFSLSSLQPSSISLESPEHAKPQERPYNSLRKKCSRKDPEQEAWRRSWGTREEGKEEFWAALQYNYNYLMDNNLIDSCKEARKDLQYGSSPSHDWNYQQFCEQFVEILTWLRSIQENIYSKQENVIDRNLRLSYLEEMNRKSFKRKLFNNQGGRLVARHPDLKDDVAWRVLTLNTKWETLEQTVTPRKRTHPDHLDVCIDVEHELRCLRKWIKQTELRLQPLDFHITWTLAELEEKAKEHEVLQRDVESHGKIVCSVLKLCEKVAWADAQTGGQSPGTFSRGRRTEASQAVRCARGLERRWQLLYLRSLEWLCHIEDLIKKLRNQSPLTVSSFDSDEEPVLKQPRLSEEGWPDKSTVEDVVDSESLMEVSVSSTSEMVGPQSEIEVSRTQSHLPTPYKSPLVTSIPDSTSLLNRPVSMQLPSKDDIINDNYPYHNDQVVMLRRQSVPPDAVRKLFLDETSTFTSSDRSAPNCATYYFKHLDTDSEQDRVITLAERKSMEESSEEDDWTYSYCDQGAEGESPNGNGDTSESASSAVRSIKHAPTRSSKETIQHLVNQAEQMVASPSHKIAARVFEPLRFNEPGSKNKFYRVKEWMKHLNDADDGKIQGVGDSCDASGEYTTEEEERHSSGDFNTTIINCHQSAEVLPCSEVDGSAVVPERSSLSNLVQKTPEHVKVIIRPKKREGNSTRPWSVSGISQLASTSASSPQLSQFSISESALHQLAQTPTNSVKMDMSVQGTLSSSTTVEETPSQAQEGSGGGYSSNSLRRRKVKLRKRNLGRKSESGSDGLSPHDPPSPLKSAPSRRPLNSGSETEDDEGGSDSKARAVRRKMLSLPAFRLGPDGGSVTVFTADKILSGGDSSFSEQAWDNYQEKYMSEAYSEETADNEAARRLLEFGDDYRNFLDSQSDCASSLSFGRGTGFHRRRRPAGATRESSVLDSDSDLEDLRSLVHQSHSTLVFSEQVYARHAAKGFNQLFRASDIEDILTTSKENIHCLRVLVEGIEDTANLLSAQECRDIRMLVDKWEALQGKAEDLQRMQTLQAEISTLKDEFVNLANRVTSVQYDNMTDREQLELRIQQVKTEMSFLRDRKSQLLQVNMAVNKFLTDTKHPAEALKEGVADLYHVWNETSQRVGQQLSSLQQLSAAWQQFDLNLSELQVALRGDHETLKQLDSAVQEGSITPDVATSVRDVAKVLSEKPEFSSTVVLNDTTTMILSTPICTEGSLSDSGISDSGSEQDLNERERRLAALRRLARRLESILSPSSQVIADIAKRIEQTEKELRGLQQTCRDLVLRTAVCAEATAQGKGVQSVPTIATQPTSQRNVSPSRRKKTNGNHKTDPDDSDPDKPTSWIWRVMRTALPFQMAIVALFCAACLLEPHCCDSMNNLNFSMMPQLRYVRGPPPI